MKIATLLTCHNRRDKTVACLSALFDSTLPTDCQLDVYLVDDGSVDGTSQVVREKFPEVNIIVGDGNLFWNRGMHRAWTVAANSYNYDYYLWLNDDTYIFKNSLIDIILLGESNNKNIFLGACCSSQNGKLTYSGFSSKNEQILPSGEPMEVCTFNGNFVLIPKYVFERVGYLDPIFHHSIGDIDYGLRASRVGVKAYIAPHYLAHCEGHDNLPLWCLKSTPLIKRIKSLYSPLGNNQPYYYFRFALRHFGPVVAIKHLLSMHVRLFFPSFWGWLKSN